MPRKGYCLLGLIQKIVIDKEKYMQCDAVYNFLKPNGFLLEIDQIPKVSYTCQVAGIPAINLTPTIQSTPFLDLNGLGDKPVFDQLSVTFIIAEDMSNYIEIYNWMIGIGFPNNYDEYVDLSEERKRNFPFNLVDHNLPMFSDGRLIVLNSNNNPVVSFRFKDMYPLSCSIPEFDQSLTKTH